jgi:hypothetical protein
MPRSRTSRSNRDRSPTPHRRARWTGVATALTAVGAALALVASPATSTPAAAATSTLFGSTAPTVEAFADNSPVTVGLRFTTRKAGTVQGVRFFKGAGNTGTHVGTLYGSAGQVLGSATFTAESAGGWQTVVFRAPVPVQAGQTLTAAVLAPRGHYAVQQSFGWPRSNGDLTGVAGTFHYGSSIALPTQTYKASNYFVDVSFAPAPAAAAPRPTQTPVAPKPSTTAEPPTAQPAGTCVGRANTPGGADPWGGCWPGPQNTGYPQGLPGDARTPVRLTAYTGPTTINSCGTVIDGKIVTGDIILQAGNGTHDPGTPCLTIRNSLVRGVIHTDEARFGPLVVSDTEVDLDGGVGWWENVGRYNTFTYRVNSHGGEGVIKCADYCEAHDNWVHGMHLGGSYHYNAFGSNGMEAADGRFVIDHNWASCGDWSGRDGAATGDAGCSADIGFYGDFAPIRNVTIHRNFLAGMRIDPTVPGARDRQPGYCLNPGYYPGKPYPSPTDVTVTENVFGRGSSGKCGVFGPTNSLNKAGSPAGNAWLGNRYEDGTVIARSEE